jgi:hypothetical protein
MPARRHQPSHLKLVNTQKSKYEIQCPFCNEWFAWFHCCLKNQNRSAERGMGEDRMKIIRWVKVGEPKILTTRPNHEA